jgi:ABC-2 type transport system ATP-binding protein
MSDVIEIHSLTKRFADVLALDTIDIHVPAGEIYGFLGINGAGKTTTIRAILGMIRPDEGEVKVLGQAVGPNGRGPWAQVGYLVESPSAYPELSVRENLDVARRLQGKQDPKIVDEIIERLQLASYTDRKAAALSTGNLQRLGLARALLHEPKLLILDEPANGLDPAGVIEIRELLRSLAHDKGTTIFMSSHILTEVDRLATRIGIIHRGKMVEELTARDLDRLRTMRLEIKSRNLEAAQICLHSAGYKYEVNGDVITIENEHAIEHPDDIAHILVNAGTPPTHLAVVQQDLEEHFMKLTGGPQ